MSNVYAYNERTGMTVVVPSHHVSHPILGADLREVRSPKRRARLSEIVEGDKPSSRKQTRLTDTVTPDNDKDK